MRVRLFWVAVLLSLTGALFSCRMTDDLAMSPEISKRVQPSANCQGIWRTLLPNEYLGSNWQNNDGGGHWQAIDEIALTEGQLDGSYLTEFLGVLNNWCRFGFTNISNPHPAAVVSDMTIRLWVEHWESYDVEIEVFTNGNLIRSATVYGDAGKEMKEAVFTNVGSLSSMNTLEVRFRSNERVKVHSMNAVMFSYVPNPDCPDPHQE